MLKKFSLRLFFIIFCINSLSGHGDETNCNTINLTEKDQIYYNYPVYDQESSQLCYAYTAAQLLDPLLKNSSHLKRRRFNPFSIALNYALSKNHQDLFQGGITCRSLESIKDTKICPSHHGFQSLHEIDVYQNTYKGCLNKNEVDCSKIRDWFPKKFNEIIKNKNPLTFLKVIEDKICPDSKKIRVPRFECENFNNEQLESSFFKSFVDHEFDSALPTPVQVGISNHLFRYASIESQKYLIDRSRSWEQTEFTLKYVPHSSTLLGRKLATNGKCQYLLRNTMTNSFCPSGIVKIMGWECDPKSGGIWINETELFNSTFEVSVLKH